MNLDLSFEHDYPEKYGEAAFRVIRLPEEWALQGHEVSDRMIRQISELEDVPSISNTLDPGQNALFTIGIKRSMIDELCSVTPYAILMQGDIPNSDWQLSQSQKVITDNDKELLYLKVGFCTIGQDYESCIFIPIGEIWKQGKQVQRRA